ncbi:MAG: beta-eliminating lyase-related protein, partial [Planctomycetota bacterium]
GISAFDWCKHFDTVSICFSKGLGAPVGSALTGSRSMIDTMRRHRKLFGGGMRQSGIISAGALFALEHNIERLAEDHECAQIIASAVRDTEGLMLEPNVVDTNIVIFRVDTSISDASQFCQRAKDAGVWMLPFSAEHVRAVTHMHITKSDAEKSGKLISELASGLLA